MGLMLMTGVVRSAARHLLSRWQSRPPAKINVATKATCQIASRFTKLIYFGGIIDQALATLDPVAGWCRPAIAALDHARHQPGAADSASRSHERRAVSPTWMANRLITTVASYYILYGSWLLLAGEFGRVLLSNVRICDRRSRSGRSCAVSFKT